MGTYLEWNFAADASCSSGQRHVSQRFTNGDLCGATPRVATVTYICSNNGSTYLLGAVNEPSICVYNLTMFVDCGLNGGNLCVTAPTTTPSVTVAPSGSGTPASTPSVSAASTGSRTASNTASYTSSVSAAATSTPSTSNTGTPASTGTGTASVSGAPSRSGTKSAVPTQSKTKTKTATRTKTKVTVPTVLSLSIVLPCSWSLV